MKILINGSVFLLPMNRILYLALAAQVGLLGGVAYAKDVHTPKQSEQRQIYWQGLALEKAYQDSLKKEESAKEPGIHLIVLGDRSPGGLDLGNIAGAASTVKSNLHGRVIVKNFARKDGIHTDEELFDYLENCPDLKKGEKFRTVHWYSHGDSESAWIDARLGEDERYLSVANLDSLPKERRDRIRTRFTDDAVFKLYSCHAAADNVERGFTQALADAFDVTVVGANSWVFVKGEMRGVFKSCGRRLMDKNRNT